MLEDHIILFKEIRSNIWDNVFKDGPSKICGRQPLKNLKALNRPYPFKFFKGCLPFLNTLVPFVSRVILKPILAQCSISIPPENARKP